MQSMLTREDYENFLVRAYFGDSVTAEPLSACTDRAYNDFSRTLHGIGDFPKREEAHRKGCDCIISKIDEMKDNKNLSQAMFDDWHRETCQSIIDIYDEVGFKNFHAGQAQKWINMIFKYIYTLGDLRISGFMSCYEYCHVPIDNILLRRLQRYGFPKLSRAWSRIHYSEYFERQDWIRRKFKLPPLDVEFRAWQGQNFDLCGITHL